MDEMMDEMMWWQQQGQQEQELAEAFFAALSKATREALSEGDIKDIIAFAGNYHAECEVWREIAARALPTQGGMQ